MRDDAGFQIWANKGVGKVQDLYKEGIFILFEELLTKYDIPRKHFFKYIQLMNGASLRLARIRSTQNAEDWLKQMLCIQTEGSGADHEFMARAILLCNGRSL